jgi:hypothetical protein
VTLHEIKLIWFAVLAGFVSGYLFRSWLISREK